MQFMLLPVLAKRLESKDYNERLYNKDKVKAISDIERIIREENVFGKISNNPSNDAVIFVGVIDDKITEIITRLDKYGDINANLAEVTLLVKGNAKNYKPQLKPIAEVVKDVAYHQSAGYSLLSNKNITQSPKSFKQNNKTYNNDNSDISFDDGQFSYHCKTHLIFLSLIVAIFLIFCYT